MKILKFLDDNLERIIISFTIILMAIVMMTQIIFRTLGASIIWAEEFSRYMFILGCSLGVSYSTKRDNHLKLDVIPSFIPALKLPFEIFADIALLIAMILLIRPGLNVIERMQFSKQFSPAMRLPMWVIYVPFLAGCIGAILRLIEKWIKRIVNKDISGEKARKKKTKEEILEEAMQ